MSQIKNAFTILLMPISITAILIMIGLLRNTKKLIYLSIGFLWIISTTIFTNYFFKILEDATFSNQFKAIPHADAIVVLSGMIKMHEFKDSVIYEWEDPDRYFGGISLMKAGKAKILVFTGGNLTTKKGEVTEGIILKKIAILNGISTEKIFVTIEVDNTEEESIAVKKIIPENKNIILVTSAFHMLRAKKLFERQGFNVIPYKLDYKTTKNGFSVIDFLPRAENLILTEKIMKELLGLFYYSIFK